MSENKPLVRIRNADGSTMAIPAFQGPPGVTFTPSVDKETGVISWTNNGAEGQFENPESVNILGPQSVYIGAEEPPVDSDYLIWVDGDQKEKEPIYFTPSVSEDGIISWTNNGGNGQYVNPAPVSIKGVKGDAGNGIDKIEQTTVSAEDDGKNVLTITVTDGTSYEFVVENGSSGTGIQSITLQGQDENGGNIYTVMLTDGTSYNITAPKGETGSGGDASNLLNADGIIKQEHLPNGYPYIGEYEEIISSTSFENDGVDGASVEINSYFDIMEGLEYTVSINDTNYIVQAKIAVVEGFNVVYIGDGTFMGGEASDEPFVIVRLPDIMRSSMNDEYGLFLYRGADSGSFTLSGPSFIKINSSYIPELYFPVTENIPGLMTPEDKIKLDGITGTNEVVVGTSTNINGIIKGNGSTVDVAIADTDYVTPSFLGRNSALTEADTNYATAMARGIYFGTEDMIAGETELLSGVIYFVYE